VIDASGKFEIAITGQIWHAYTSSRFLLPSHALCLSLPLSLSFSPVTETTTSWYNGNFKVSLVLESSRKFLPPFFLRYPFLPLCLIFLLSQPSFHRNVFTRQRRRKKSRRVLGLCRGLNDESSRLGWRRKISDGQKLLYPPRFFSSPFTNDERGAPGARD